MLTIQTGGTLVSFSLSSIGNFVGSQGTVTVTGAGSNLQINSSVVVGSQGTGTLTIEDGGAASSAGGSIGSSAGSNGTVTVTGPGSSWTNGPSGGLNVGSAGTGTLTIANGGQVINFTTNTAANIGSGAGSQGTVTVTGAGSLWSNRFGLNIGNSGTGTLTITDGGVVSALASFVIAANPGSIGTLNIGAAPGDPAAAPGTVQTSIIALSAGTATINFNHTAADYVFAPTITGNGTVNVLAGSTTLTAANNNYSGATNIDAGILRAGAPGAFSPNSAVTIAGSGMLDLNGFSQTLPSVRQCRLGEPGHGHGAGRGVDNGQLHGRRRYDRAEHGFGRRRFAIGQAGDRRRQRDRQLVLHITNAGGSGGETVANGIAVVQAINGGSTATGAFQLGNIVAAGPFDYRLFRGSVDASAPNDWFLRSDFVVPPTGGGSEPPIPPTTELPPDPPPASLPPGTYPIIGPRLATYGVVQPIARQIGLTALGTLHERIGNTLTIGNPAPTPKAGSAPPGAASSASRSTITTKPTPTRAPAAG